MDNTAIYIDYDNVYIMLERYYQRQDSSSLAVDIVKEIRNLYKDDKILTFKAFCDFQKSGKQLSELQKQLVELRHVYSSGEGDGRKNASDIALAIDVVKNLFNKPDCNKYVLVSSDSDMLPLINEITYNGKKVEVIYSTRGIKDGYEENIKEWGITSYTIEGLLKIEPYTEINDEEIETNLSDILDIINEGINLEYTKYAKEVDGKRSFGTSSRKSIRESLKSSNKYNSNDISIII